MFESFMMPRPFDTNDQQAPAWKMGEGGTPELRDGNPVYIASDGSEGVFDIRTLPTLNAEARAERERARTTAEQLKRFDGIDPDAARDALQRVAVMDSVAAINDEWEKKYKPVAEENANLKSRLESITVEQAFAQSKYVQERLSLPVDLVQAAFGRNFKYEDGELVAYGNDGQRLLSARNSNGVPDFDEALELLVSKYPHRDKIVRRAK